jgi:threonine dehydratase
VVGGARFDDAQAACDAYVAETGALKVHPFASEMTIAGQGTLAREWEAQVQVDTALIAAGGGGLIAGVASWWGTSVRVVGVEPEGSTALHSALAAGGPVTVEVNSVAADSLGAKNVGDVVYRHCAGMVDHVALVPDAAITAAQKWLWQEMRVAAEPGGAAALAAVLSGAYQPGSGERVGILLCGANVDLERLAAL